MLYGVAYSGATSMLRTPQRIKFFPRWDDEIRNHQITCLSSKLLILSFPIHCAARAYNP